MPIDTEERTKDSTTTRKEVQITIETIEDFLIKMRKYIVRTINRIAKTTVKQERNVNHLRKKASHKMGILCR